MEWQIPNSINTQAPWWTMVTNEMYVGWMTPTLNQHHTPKTEVLNL